MPATAGAASRRARACCTRRSRPGARIRPSSQCPSNSSRVEASSAASKRSRRPAARRPSKAARSTSRPAKAPKFSRSRGAAPPGWNATPITRTCSAVSIIALSIAGPPNTLPDARLQRGAPPAGSSRYRRVSSSSRVMMIEAAGEGSSRSSAGASGSTSQSQSWATKADSGAFGGVEQQTHGRFKPRLRAEGHGKVPKRGRGHCRRCRRNGKTCVAMPCPGQGSQIPTLA
jgi:hypothetical protein